jgi:glycosyltransferase involved in cell wall biosynthesis
LRILLVVRPARGGLRRHLLALAEGLTAAGVTFEAAGPDGDPLLRELAALGYPVHDLPLSASFRPAEDFKAAFRLTRLLQRRQYDLVHVHGFKASLPGRVGAALAGVPAVYTVHNFVLEAGGGFRRQAYLWVEQALAPLTARYIAVSEAVRRDLVTRAHLPTTRFSVVYNGVPAHVPTPLDRLADLRRELALPEAVPAVLCVARLVPEKGVDLLLQAASALAESSRAGDPLPPFRLLIAGDGPEEGTLRELAGRLGLAERVVFLGHRPDVPALLDLAAAVVLPSRAEGLSLVLLEALVAGRPVVASRAGGMSEVVADGEHGLLVPVGDPLALAAALRRLLTDRALAARLSMAARERGARFTIDSMLRQTLAVYAAAIDRRG